MSSGKKFDINNFIGHICVFCHCQPQFFSLMNIKKLEKKLDRNGCELTPPDSGRIRLRAQPTRPFPPLASMSYNGIFIIKLFVHKHQFPRFCHRMIYIVLIIMFSVMVRTLFAIKGISKTIPEGTNFCFVHIISTDFQSKWRSTGLENGNSVYAN